MFAPSEALEQWNDDSLYSSWAATQLASNPAMRTVYDQLGAWLKQTQPATVRELVQKSCALASEVLAGTPALAEAGPAARHYTTLVGLVAVAGHSLARRDDSMRGLFPDYIADGRDEPNAPWTRSGIDKAMHLVNQALFAYVARFDQVFGPGKTATAFLASAERVDPKGYAAQIAQAYEKTKGQGRSLLNQSVAVRGETEVPYFARPTDLSTDEAPVYDAAVRVGDQHEWQPAWGELPAIGDHSSDDDPLAPVDFHAAVTGGVADSGVNRDLTADRVGAWLGLALFRDPGGVPEIPFDDGAQWTSRPYEPGFKGTYASYYADESFLLAKLSAPGSAERPLVRATHATWAEQVGPREAAGALTQKVDALVDRLGTTDRPTLNRYYANFSVRQLRMAVPFGEGPLESPHSATHLQHAGAMTLDELRGALHHRLQAITLAHDVRESFDVMKQRALFDPSLGRFAGPCTVLLDGAAQSVTGKHYPGGSALLVARAAGPAFVVQGELLKQYQANTHPAAQGRYLYEVLGLPTGDFDGRRQRFQHGFAEVNPAGGVEIKLDP